MEFDDLLNELAEEIEPPKQKDSKKKDIKGKKIQKPLTSKINQYSDDDLSPRPFTTKTKKKRDYSDSDKDLFDILKSSRNEDSSLKESKNSSEENFKSIEDRIQYIREQQKQELEQQKSEFLTYKAQVLQEKQKFFSDSLELQKREYDEQIRELQKIKDNYEKMQNISDTLGFSTTLLDNISQQLIKNKEDTEANRDFKFEKMEKMLEEREKAIFDREQKLDRELFDVQENLDSIKKQENEMREYYDGERKRIIQENQKVHSIYLTVLAEVNEKKQETAKETHKIKVMKEALEKRKEKVNQGVGNRLKELEDIEELLIAKHEETLKMINVERRQLSEKREKLEEKKMENQVFEDKLKQNIAIVERREAEINSAVDELIKNKNTIESQRLSLEAEMQNLHKLSLKLHSQSENISRSKEQMETEFNLLAKQEEDVENMKNYSKHEMITAKETWRSLEQQMRTFERMSVNLLQDLNPSSNWIIN